VNLKSTRANKVLLNKKFEKIIEYLILILSSVYFVGFILFDTNSIGLENILPKPANFDLYFDTILWSIFVTMIPDLSIKYIKSENWKKFLRKNWIDISFFILIPLFAWLRILKVLQFANQLKVLKIVKSLLKVIYEGNRVLVPLLFGYRLIQKLGKKSDTQDIKKDSSPEK
jgi:hypothetical protein